MVLSSSNLYSLRGSIIVPAVVSIITLIFLSLTASNSNNALLQSQSAFAQQQEEAFLSYENPTWGISMQYPSNWTASWSGLLDYTELIAFYSPIQNLSQPFPARLTISGVQFSQNLSLPEYTDFILTELQNQPESDVMNSSETTIAGYPGYRVVVANTPFQNNTLTVYSMNMWTTVGNRLYIVTYDAEELTFNQHLHEVNQMLDFLRLIPE
jgi:hypothetical protein